ncbi:MAG: superoxide dismutase [Candidatus Paceibacterota bacterium]|jgi:Fe-Mn family superoxide dismutase
MYELPKLPYAYDALEPWIDARTMEIHHTKHHATYVAKLNEALAPYPELSAQSVEQLVKNLASLPEAVRGAVKNHGGGHANHSLFWTVMGPQKGGEPVGKTKNAITSSLVSFGSFKEQFSKAALGVFGSGWVWLVGDSQGALKIMTTPNQESPLTQGLTPILCLDVWEHAYYLKFQNRRTEYIEQWWNVVNWDEVENQYTKAILHG